MGRTQQKEDSRKARTSNYGGDQKPLKSATGVRAKKRRFRPGTLALMHIRRFQRQVKPQLRKSPFIRNVRAKCEELSDQLGIRQGWRFTKTSLTLLQLFIETRTVEYLRDSQAVCCKNGGVKLLPRHAETVQALKYPNIV